MAVIYIRDQIYYPTMAEKQGAPYGLWVHGGSDTTGAVRAAESIVSGLTWRAVHAPVEVTGSVDKADREACFDLGGTVAASLMA